MADPAAGALKAALRQGWSGSLASLLIKVATAGLTYLAYVVLARVMDGTEYGYFAFGLSLASILAIAAGVGQQIAVMRLWSEENAKQRPEAARTALRAGGAITVAGGLAIGLGLAAIALALGALVPGGEPVSHLYATALLILPVALAEYNSAALRAQGSIWTAQAPRDLLWRLALPAAALLFPVLGIGLSGWGALLLAAALLAAALLVQYGLAARRHYLLAPGLDGVGAYWRERGGISRWFLAGGLISAVSLNADTILVGALVDPHSAGAYFNAMRTAGLMTLFSFAVSLVISPILASHFHAGEMRRAQAILAVGSWGGFVFALAAFFGLVLFGEEVMGLFGAEYRETVPVLLILSLGFAVDAATGPTRSVLTLTGHERIFATSFGLATMATIVLQFAVLPVWGVTGMAVVTAGSVAAVKLMMVWLCISKAGLDPTVLGILRIKHVAEEAGPEASRP